jgi:hypothetical protein
MIDNDFLSVSDNRIFFRRLPNSLEFSEFMSYMELNDLSKDIISVSYNYLVSNIAKDSEYIHDEDRLIKELLK